MATAAACSSCEGGKAGSRPGSKAPSRPRRAPSSGGGGRGFDVVVVCGPAGCGKSTVARALAERRRGSAAAYVDADDLHSAEARAKMARGEPLTDDDRWPWLARVAAAAAEGARDSGVAVVACSALSIAHRAALAEGLVGPETRLSFVLLDVPRAELERRVAARRGHFVPASLVASQLAALEPDDPRLQRVDGTLSLLEVVALLEVLLPTTSS